MTNQSDEITIIYDVNKDEGSIKIFGSEFVKIIRPIVKLYMKIMNLNYKKNLILKI